MAARREFGVIAEQRVSEIEDAAQRQRMIGELSRFDLRTPHEIEEIDAALMRLAGGEYGGCERCRRRIAIARLEALPATRS